MFFFGLFMHGLILLQTLEATDITGLMSAKELTVNGLLLVAIIMLWRKMTAAEEKIDIIRKESADKIDALRRERDEDYKKYVDLLVTTTKIIDGNTKMYEKLEKILNK